MERADSMEFDDQTPNPVVVFMPEVRVCFEDQPPFPPHNRKQKKEKRFMMTSYMHV